jgi:hypothetical protein
MHGGLTASAPTRVEEAVAREPVTTESASGLPSRSAGDTVHNEPLESSIQAPTLAVPPEDRLPPALLLTDEELARQDRVLDKGLVPLSLVGIPVPRLSGGTRVFSPSAADRERLAEVDAQLSVAWSAGNIAADVQPGYIAERVDGRKTVYVDPTFHHRFLMLVAERAEIHERSMQAAPLSEQLTYYAEPRKARRFPDGSFLEYYRRRDGALIRSVTQPGGAIRKWVIGWASTDAGAYGLPSDVLANAMRGWRDE